MIFNPPIRLAVNYSLEIDALLQDGLVQVDLYKLPDWPELISSIDHRRPSYVHFTLLAGTGELNQIELEWIAQLQRQTGTQYINLHLAAPEESNPHDPWHGEQIIRQAIADVRLVGDYFGIENVILENVPIRLDQEYLLPVVDPAVITRVIRETGCGLLLDLAHARLSARMLGIDERDYLEAFPVESLRELHITGIGLHDGIWVDHLAMQAEDWDLLDWSLAQIQAGSWSTPAIAALEYGGLGEVFCWRSERAVLQVQVPQIWRRLHIPD